jgi:chemosensory pili system protein ChpA (sensor histidine kinase/response regulator)
MHADTQIDTEDQNQGPVQSISTACERLEHCLRRGDTAAWQELQADFSSHAWRNPMAPDAIASLVDALNALGSAAELQAAITTPLTLEDMTTSPSAEVSPETISAYFAETPQMAAELSAFLARVTGVTPSTSYVTAQRLVHTIKGSSSLVGLHAVAHLSHALESALQILADSRLDSENGADINAEARLIASRAADMIEMLIEQSTATANDSHASDSALEALELIHSLSALGNTEPIADSANAHVDATPFAAAIQQDTLAFDRGLGSDSIPESNIVALRPVERSVSLVAKAGRSDDSSENALAENNAAVGSTLNVPVAVIDDNLRRTGELNTAIGQLMAQVKATLDRADRLTQQLARIQGQVYELETLVDTRGVPAMRHDVNNIGNGEFDPLEMDEYTALHSLSRAFCESTLDSRELSRELSEELLRLQNLVAQHARLGKELNDSVTGTRLVPVASIVPRLERIVRQTARHTQREVELVIEGRDHSIDTDILSGLVEPLMHALRNAIDHGIEPVAERLAAGKPRAGAVRLSFRREGNRIEVRLQDDGRGLNFESIARRAHERGLLVVGKPVTERELTQIVFAPGFSTRDSVTAISGRGIGMDVVRASIEKLKGTVHLESRTGMGCTLLLRLPLSLTSQHTLFVGVGECVYGLPSTTVEQVLYSDAGRVVALGNQFGFEYANQVSPLYSLGVLLGHADANLHGMEAAPRPLVLVRGDDGLVAIAVDRALDSREIVIKGLSPLLPSLPGVAGAAVLPDGGIGIILEVRDLLRLREQKTMTASSAVVATNKTVRRALVIDDSLSARRGLAQLLNDAGYAVTTAVDGMDALTQMETQSPDLILVDMEMPRMNGLELTAHLRNDVNFGGVPIVMITSRATEKHRTQALRAGVSEFITKPYIEHELIDRLYTLAPP